MRSERVVGALGLLMTALLAAHAARAQTASNVVCTQCVDGTDLANDSIGGSKLKDGSIRTNDLAAGAVKSTNIATGQVSIGKLSPEIRGLLDASIVTLSTQGVTASDFVVAGADCPDDRIPISASCSCDPSIPTSNLGLLAACYIDGSGAVGACLNDGLSFDPGLNDPVVHVMAVCLGAQSADGSPWLPAPTGLASYAKSGVPSSDSDSKLLQWRKEQSDKFETAIQETRDAYRARSQRLRSR